jgi:hypothetical protein
MQIRGSDSSLIGLIGRISGLPSGADDIPSGRWLWWPRLIGLSRFRRDSLHTMRRPPQHHHKALVDLGKDLDPGEGILTASEMHA